MRFRSGDNAGSRKCLSDRLTSNSAPSEARMAKMSEEDDELEEDYDDNDDSWEEDFDEDGEE
jgi:hypothetical protein